MGVRKKRQVFIVRVRDEESDSPTLMVAHTRYGRVVGEVPCAVAGEELQKLARFQALHQETPLFVIAGDGERGQLVDPVLIGFQDSLEKVAAALDPLTVATTNWQQKKHNKRYLPPVIAELRKVVAGRAQDFASRGGPVIPQAEFMKAGLKALRKYDPSRGVRASTFVVGSLKGAHRPLLRRATPVRVPEQRLQQVGKVRRAERVLENRLGRAPTTAEIASQARVKETDVVLLQKEVKPVHMQTKEEVPHGTRASRVKEVWSLLPPELTGTELAVYRFLDKNPNAKNTAIAQRLGISSSQVSRYRQKLRRRVEAHAKP